jgi:hypothetical protein
LRSDSSPIVGAWSSYLAATLAGGEAQGKILGEMSRSTEWSTRLLSLFVPGTGQKEISARLAGDDPDQTVKAAAGATLQLIEQAATQPASQPAGATTQP